jgi:hypothetical protein
MKFIHIGVVAVSVVLSLVPVAAALGTGGYGLPFFPVHL